MSESAATGSTEMDDLSWLLSDTNRRTKPFSSLRDRAKTTKERMTKLRYFFFVITCNDELDFECIVNSYKFYCAMCGTGDYSPAISVFPRLL